MIGDVKNEEEHKVASAETHTIPHKRLDQTWAW